MPSYGPCWMLSTGSSRTFGAEAVTTAIPIRPAQVSGFSGLAASPHMLSTQAAMLTLDRGGNAIDAAIAMNAVQGVVAPETCGIGGDLFALIHGPGFDRPLALNASGRAGSGADAEELRATGVSAIPQRHPAAVPVPGCVDGWLALAERLGSLDLEMVLEPAVRLATDGFPANREMAAAFAGRFEELAAEPAAADMFPNGAPPLEGERITRPRLAATMEGIAQHGRGAFYSGAVGAAISEAVDGCISAADLELAQADWVDPLSIDVFGLTAWTIPPNSQGYISLLALAILERLGVGNIDDPLAWHYSVEAYRAAAADRDEILADPLSMTTDPAALLAADRIDRLCDTISPDMVGSHPAAAQAAGGTAYMCVVDSTGLGISLIQSNFHGIGSGRSVAQGGFLLHDRGRGFDLRPGHPNELRAGRRPLHTLSPTLWTDQARLACLLGTRGGHNQPQLVIQLASRALGSAFEPGKAMAVPRWATDVPASSQEPRLELEPGVSDHVVSGLARRGHLVHRVEVPQAGWGPMSMIRMGRDGLAVGAADPRVDTAAAAGR